MAEAGKEILRAAKSGDLAKVKDLVATDAALVHAHDTDGSTYLLNQHITVFRRPV